MKSLVLAVALVVPTSLALAGEPNTKIATRTLDNGVRVVAREARGTGLVALACFVNGGNRTEPPELSGLSHYYEHLVFRGGTAKQKELETRKVFTQLGTFYGYTTEDATCFYFVVPVSNLDEALWRHFDAVTKVLVTQDKVDKERDVVMNEYRMSIADSPSGTLWHELYRNAFTKHPYGRTTIGLREVIEGSKLDRFRSFYEERYVANQMVISVTGDLPLDELVARVEATWKAAPRGKESFELGVVEPEPTETRTFVQEREGTTQSYLALAFPATPAMDKRRVVDDVLSYVLSGGEGSRLQRELVAARLALSAGAYSPSCKETGLFAISLEVEPDKESQALEKTVAILRDMASTGPTQEEVDNAKRRLENETIFGGESLKDDAIRMGTWVIMGDENAGLGYVRHVQAVTASDVRAAARELFRSTRATFGAVRPKRPAVDWKAIVHGLDGAAAAGALVEHASGARVIIEESQRNRVVALDMKVAGGQLAEPAGEGGVAQLTERLLTRGTTRLDRAAFARELDRLAVRISTASGSESTTLSIRATDDTFEAAIALLGEMIHEPAFAEDEVKSAREETLEAIASVEDDSFALTQQAFADALYGAAHPYGRPLLGTKESVRALGREAVVRFHARTFRPESMVIAVAGAIDRAKALALVEKHLLAGFPAAADATAPRRFVVPAAPPARARTILLDRKREQATLNLGLPLVSISDPDYLPLQVALRHLGTELFFRYVYEQGKAYRMWTYLRPGIGVRPLVLETGVAAPSFVGVKDGLLAAVTSLVENGLSSEELVRAKKDFLNGVLLARQTSEDRARSLSSFELQGVGYDWEDRLPGLLDAITVAQVKDALRRRIDPSKLTLVVVGDRAALEAQGASFPVPETREPD